MNGPLNRLRGDYEAVLAGERHRFDTRLGTIAAIEDACGDGSIVAIVARVVDKRRAADQIALVTAALKAAGVDRAATIAAATSVGEAEAFILALMGALGFRLSPQPSEGSAEAGDDDPLAASPAGTAGGPSLSAV